jgi:hypothetical protein
MNPNPATNFSQIHTYTLTIAGKLEADFTAAFCPPETTLVQEGEALILSNLQVDQSGLLGILRSLHNFGCLLISLSMNTGGTR